jgi:hypothetical protein
MVSQIRIVDRYPPPQVPAGVTNDDIWDHL